MGFSACVAKDPENLGVLVDDSSGGSSDSEPSSETSGSSMSSTTVDPTDPGSTSSNDGPGTLTTSVEESTGDDTTEPPACEDPSLDEFHPAYCLDEAGGVMLPAQGCYESCDGPEAPCETGRCLRALIDPCICPNAECCDFCSGQEWLCLDDEAIGVCAALVGRTFSSLEQLECGKAPDRQPLCNWQIDLNVDGTYTWLYSDVGQAGDYACDAGQIVTSGGAVIDVSYDVDTDILTWDGVEYQ